MENKIQQLTDKLLSEGVEKGKAEAAKIIADANAESENIIANAKQKADDIIAQAKKDAEALNKNTRSELQMFAGQAESALKTQLTNVLTDCSVAEVVKKMFHEMVAEIEKPWSNVEEKMTNDGVIM